MHTLKQERTKLTYIPCKLSKMLKRTESDHHYAKGHSSTRLIPGKVSSFPGLEFPSLSARTQRPQRGTSVDFPSFILWRGGGNAEIPHPAAGERTPQYHLAEAAPAPSFSSSPKAVEVCTKPKQATIANHSVRYIYIFIFLKLIFPTHPSTSVCMRTSQQGQCTPFRQNYFSISNIQHKLCDFAQHSSTE